MHKPFIGFSTDRQKTVRVPEGFFEDVLPAITSVLEMKVTLHLFWRLSRVRNALVAAGIGDSALRPPHSAFPRMVSLEELEADEQLRSALSPSKGPRPFNEALCEGLELAVARGTVLQLSVREDGEEQVQEAGSRWFMLNTRENRAWIASVAKGEVDIIGTRLAESRVWLEHGNGSSNHSKIHNHNSKVSVVVERPSIYALYEQNIGLLTPLLAERLQDAEARYPVEWIEEAFEEAVANNKRNWRYIERILERWAAEGRGDLKPKPEGRSRSGDGEDRGPVERTLDPDKYTKGKYAFLFRPERE